MGCADPSLLTGQQGQSVVYGEDDRRDVYDHPDPLWQTLARRSIVALVPRQNVEVGPDGVDFTQGTLNEVGFVCPDERFADQQVGSNCSGTLIAPDLVVTAGHCIDERSCNGTLLAFDWLYEAPGQLAHIGQEDLYRCVEIVGHRLNATTDIAVIRLDRPAEGREPVPVRWDDAPLPRDTPLGMIGFPSGLPAKIDTGGRVVGSGGPFNDRFEATVDAFGGNSGSGVFDHQGVMVGVLVAGNQDYVQRGNCLVPNRLGENARDAEDVVYVTRGREAVCTDSDPEHPLCGTPGRGWCLGCASPEDCAPGFDCVEGRCAADCQQAFDCRSDHRCEGGACLSFQLACEGDVIVRRDACGGGEDERVEDCAPRRSCEAGACVERAARDRCEDAEEIEAVNQVLVGDLSRARNDDSGRCAGDGPDRFFRFRVDEPTQLDATATGFDTVLYLREGCRHELACNDDAQPPGGFGSHLVVDLEPGVYELGLDTFDDSAGDYRLRLAWRSIVDRDARVPPPPRDAQIFPPDRAEPPPPVDARPPRDRRALADAAPPPPPRDARVRPRDRGVGPPLDAGPPPPPPRDAGPPPPDGGLLPDRARPPPPPPVDAEVDPGGDASSMDAGPPVFGEDSEQDLESPLNRAAGCQATPGR